MNPFEGQRQLEIRAEQVVWHLVSVGIIGLLLLVLLVSVSLIDERAAAGRDPATQMARPVENGEVAPASTDVSRWVPVGADVTGRRPGGALSG